MHLQGVSDHGSSNKILKKKKKAKKKQFQSFLNFTLSDFNDSGESEIKYH